MSKLILGKAGKQLFERHLEQYAPADPLYEYSTDERGKQKKKKRELPPGLSARDAAILKSVKKRAHYLDKGFSICGLRFGWTFLIGLIPIVGDVTDASLNYFLVVRKARQADLPKWLVRRMLFNNAVSAGVGCIPFVGDVVLAIFKANSRNAALLEELLRIRGEEFLKLGGVVEDPAKGGKLVKNAKAKKAGEAISKSDAEQVKPGAGMTPSEMKQVTNAPPADDSQVASTSKSATKDKKSPNSGSGSSGFSFFGSRKKSSNKKPLKAGSRDSKFIENVEAPK